MKTKKYLKGGAKKTKTNNKNKKNKKNNRETTFPGNENVLQPLTKYIETLIKHIDEDLEVYHVSQQIGNEITANDINDIENLRNKRKYLQHLIKNQKTRNVEYKLPPGLWDTLKRNPRVVLPPGEIPPTYPYRNKNNKNKNNNNKNN